MMALEIQPTNAVENVTQLELHLTVFSMTNSVRFRSNISMKIVQTLSSSRLET